MYIDWFAPTSGAHSRRAKTADDPAWDYDWAKPHYSWILFEDTALTPLVVSKCIHDGASGTIIVPSPARNAGWFNHLQAQASVVLRIASQPNSFTMAGQPAAHPSTWIAFIIDDFSALPPVQESFDISVPDDWDSLYHNSQSPLVYATFKHFLSYHPDDAFVTRVLRGILYGRSYGYTGPRTIQKTCVNPRDWSRYKPQLLAIREKEKRNGWRAGPFPKSRGPPLFNLICSPLN